MSRIRFAPLLVTLAVACLVGPPQARADVTRHRVLPSASSPADTLDLAARREALAAPRALVATEVELRAIRLSAERFAGLMLRTERADSLRELAAILDEVETMPELVVIDGGQATDGRLVSGADHLRRLREGGRLETEALGRSGLGEMLARGVWMPSSDGD